MQQKNWSPTSAKKGWPVDRNHLSGHFLWKHKNVNYKITCLTFAVIATETAVGKNVYLGQW